MQFHNKHPTITARNASTCLRVLIAELFLCGSGELYRVYFMVGSRYHQLALCEHSLIIHLPEVSKVNLNSITRYQFLYFWSREHAQPIIVDYRFEASDECCCLLSDLCVHFKSSHVVYITDPKTMDIYHSIWVSCVEIVLCVVEEMSTHLFSLVTAIALPPGLNSKFLTLPMKSSSYEKFKSRSDISPS